MALIVKRGFIQDKFNIVVVPKKVVNTFLEKHVERITTGKEYWKAFTVLIKFNGKSSTWDEKPTAKETIAIVLVTLKKGPIILLPRTKTTPKLRIPLLIPENWKVRIFDPISKSFATEPTEGDLVVDVEKYTGGERQEFLTAFAGQEHLSWEKIKLNYYFRKYPGNRLLIYFITHMHVAEKL